MGKHSLTVLWVSSSKGSQEAYTEKLNSEMNIDLSFSESNEIVEYSRDIACALEDVILKQDNWKHISICP